MIVLEIHQEILYVGLHNRGGNGGHGWQIQVEHGFIQPTDIVQDYLFTNSFMCGLEKIQIGIFSQLELRKKSKWL